jgi:hypothetical protein
VMVRKPNKTIFFPPKSKSLAKIITIKSPKGAREASRKLVARFRRLKTRPAKRRTKRAVVLAANRAAASRKRKNLSAKERKQMLKVERIYRVAASKMVLPVKNRRR